MSVPINRALQYPGERAVKRNPFCIILRLDADYCRQLFSGLARTRQQPPDCGASAMRSSELHPGTGAFRAWKRM